MYRRRRFDAEIIELCVRWYITYRLSYRDLVAMMAERGIAVSHTTIHRWVIRYVPEFEKRWNRFARPVNTSWRVDETYIKVRGKWNYLYRDVDRHGETVDFLFGPDRGIAAALDGHALARNRADHVAARLDHDELAVAVVDDSLAIEVAIVGVHGCECKAPEAARLPGGAGSRSICRRLARSGGDRADQSAAGLAHADVVVCD